MTEYGLLGRKLHYSYSKKIHESFGLYEYELFEKEPEELDDFFSNRKWKGINITIPYKQTVRKYCDELTHIAKRISAVNTIYEKDGRLIGDNTDFYGFLHTLNLINAKVEGKTVLILGRGGAAKCVREAMKDRRAGFIRETSREDLKDLSESLSAQIIVNATPIGTADTEHEAKSPCDLRQFKDPELVIDLVYNPAETPLLSQAKSLGIKCIGGMEMLKFQAEKAAHRFMQSKTVALIGMPGCGKSSIGRLLAEKSGRVFIDLDEEIEKKTGRSPGDIIRNDGEAAFRKTEHEVFAEAMGTGGQIISCGGGTACFADNTALLKNCLTIWLQRDLELLDKDTAKRPLSSDIKKLWIKRAPLYENAADIIFDNNSSPDDCVSDIRRVCKI